MVSGLTWKSQVSGRTFADLSTLFKVMSSMYTRVCVFVYLGLHWGSVTALLFSSCCEQGSSPFWCVGLSSRQLLLLRSTGFRLVGCSSCGPQSPEHSVSSCGSWAQLLCGFQGLLDQRSNPCPLQWQADSLPLSHQGSPCLHLYDKLWAEFSNKQRTHSSSPPGSVLLQDTSFLFAFPILVAHCGVLKK